MIKCSCGNEGCTTELAIVHSVGDISLALTWEDGNKRPDQRSIALNPNDVINLIKELKRALNDIINQPFYI